MKESNIIKIKLFFFISSLIFFSCSDNPAEPYLNNRLLFGYFEKGKFIEKSDIPALEVVTAKVELTEKVFDDDIRLAVWDFQTGDTLLILWKRFTGTEVFIQGFPLTPFRKRGAKAELMFTKGINIPSATFSHFE